MTVRATLELWLGPDDGATFRVADTYVPGMVWLMPVKHVYIDVEEAETPTIRGSLMTSRYEIVGEVMDAKRGRVLRAVYMGQSS